MNMKKILAGILTAVLVLIPFSGCTSADNAADGSDYSNVSIVYGDAGWDSVKVHTQVAGMIAQEVFGYKDYSEMTASSTIVHEGLLKNEIEVYMENWTDSIASYTADVEAGKLQEMGVNFDDNAQGLYVPRYVIEGDEERGIEALAPDLKTVEDLKNYPEVFPDDENPSRGRIYGAIPGWMIDEIMYQKYIYYGLDENYEYFRPGSEAAMNATISSFYEKGDPIVCYYWEPTWMLGKYDFVLLEDAPYTNDEDYQAGKTECPSMRITVTTSNEFAENNPEYCEFLKKYKTSSESTSEALSYMQDSGADHKETAKWFMRENDAMLDEWLEPDQAEIMREFLSE